MKKLCKNCKWYEIGFWHRECWKFWKYYSRENKIYQDFVGKLEIDLVTLNKYNGCVYYKRKFWWKK